MNYWVGLISRQFGKYQFIGRAPNAHFILGSYSSQTKEGERTPTVDLYLIRIFISLETTYITLPFLLPFPNFFAALANIHWEKYTAMVLPLICPRHLLYIYTATPQNTSKTLITGPKVFFPLYPFLFLFTFRQ